MAFFSDPKIVILSGIIVILVIIILKMKNLLEGIRNMMLRKDALNSTNTVERMSAADYVLSDAEKKTCKTLCQMGQSWAPCRPCHLATY